MDFLKIDLPSLGDERGGLVVAEYGSHIPFDIKRVYSIFETKPGVRRGFHAHRQLIQAAIVLSGSCRFLLDDGTDKVDVLIDSPTQALMIDPLIWHEMYDFSDDCVLLMLASDLYDESDYLRDYDQFLAFCNNSFV
ncbi:FdtA/QdtA family cupin domain-containing protein [Vibrio splendidus]